MFIKQLLIVMLFFIMGIWTSHAQIRPTTLADAFKLIDRTTDWSLVAEIEIGFDTYHPQGFALIDDYLFMSSVEVHEKTQRFPVAQGGFDRTPGVGVGHIFKMDMQGTLLARTEIGAGDVYHPGGIDYDGEVLWIPVAEYRPDSHSIIYSMHPDSLNPIERFRIQDHIGGIVANTTDNTLHAVSWGSRRYYSWPRHYTPLDIEEPLTGTLNPSHYIDYQDCQYTGNRTAICTGLAGFYQAATQTRFALGGIELVDLQQNQPIHQVPFPYWTESGLPMTQNPVVLELDGARLRLYAMPEDNSSRLYIFETDLSNLNQ